jgi:predicted MFS family arabinose efflux permease
MLNELSPKAVVAFLIPFLASIVLAIVFHDATFLYGLLLAAATGGASVAAPPAPRVTQAEVAELSEDKRDRFGPRT